MKKPLKIFFFIFILCFLFTAAAYASGEPSAEPSGEPSAEPVAQTGGEPSTEPSGEPSEEPVAQTRSASFDVTIMVNGSEYAKVPVTISVTGDKYSFQVGELLNALGVNLRYDEMTAIASIAPEPESVSAILMAGMQAGKDGASDEPPASGEPEAEEAVPAMGAASDEPAASGEPSEEPVAASSLAVVAKPRAFAAPKPGWYHYI